MGRCTGGVVCWTTIDNEGDIARVGVAALAWFVVLEASQLPVVITNRRH